MINVNIGGVKQWDRVPPSVRKRWGVLDAAGTPDYKYDLNSGTFFPFKDNVIDNFYTSHVLEHISPELLGFVLREIYRTMKPAALIRVVVPDVELAIRKYVEGNMKWLVAKQRSRARHGYPNTLLGHLMLWFYSLPSKGLTRSGHNVVFDWTTLQFYFHQAGFKNIRKLSYNKSSSVFEGLDFKRHADSSLYLEAQK